MHPLLQSFPAWFAATPAERAEAVQWVADLHPQLRPGPEEPTMAHVPGLSWLTLDSEQGPLELQLVPGGPSMVGFTPGQEARVRELAAKNHHLGPSVLEPLLRFSKPPRSVELRPFLLSVAPVQNGIVRKVVPDFEPAKTGMAEWMAKRFDDGSPEAVLRQRDKETARLTRPQAAALADGLPDLRLPSEVEWEHAMRAGQDTLFWWGDDVPWEGWPDEADPPLGFIFAGALPEACADDWHTSLDDVPADGSPRVGQGAGTPGVVRGGAEVWSPFQNGFEWRVSMLAWRTTWFPDLRVEQGGMVARAAVRLVMDIPKR